MTDRLTQTRARLLISQPFFGTLALRLQLRDSRAVETMSTDGEYILYNQTFVDELDNDELLGVMAHEVMHCSNLHHLRRGDRKRDTWNEACDYAINSILVENGFKLPKGALVDQKYVGMSAEHIYAQLPKSSGEDKSRNRPDPGRCGGVHEPIGDGGNPISDSEKKQQEAEWKAATLQAHQASKTAGNEPAGMERIIETIRHPKISWRVLLSRFVSERDCSDYDWSRPNRRFLHQGMYLPSMESPALGEIIIACDTSASIDQDQIDQVNAELNAILGTAAPSQVTVLHCNTQITKVETFTPDQGTVTLAPVGSGGTDLLPPFDWIRENGKRPAAIVYFTDLITRRGFPESSPAPLIWITPNTRRAPIGTTISLTFD